MYIIWRNVSSERGIHSTQTSTCLTRISKTDTHRNTPIITSNSGVSGDSRSTARHLGRDRIMCRLKTSGGGGGQSLFPVAFVHCAGKDGKSLNYGFSRVSGELDWREINFNKSTKSHTDTQGATNIPVQQPSPERSHLSLTTGNNRSTCTPFWSVWATSPGSSAWNTTDSSVTELCHFPTSQQG